MSGQGKSKRILFYASEVNLLLDMLDDGIDLYPIQLKTQLGLFAMLTILNLYKRNELEQYRLKNVYPSKFSIPQSVINANRKKFETIGWKAFDDVL
jgi:hypothetical protein